MERNKRLPLLPALYLTALSALSSTVVQADLLGLTANLPTVTFGATGVIEYNANTSTVTVSGDPSKLFSLFPVIDAEVIDTSTEDIKDIAITFQIDATGNIVPNDAATPDLIVTGAIDVDGDGIVDYSGTLLSAEVSQFGFQNGTSGGDDVFDLRLNRIGGDLAYLYSGRDLAISILSAANNEYATPFDGGFNTTWQSQASGKIGSTPSSSSVPPASDNCHLKMVAKCSVDGGPYRNKCRIKVTKSANHWERYEYAYNGQTFQMSKYGTHGYSIPAWATSFPTTQVTFKYNVTNDGDNPVSNILIEDSFDTPISGYQTSLAPGTSLSTTRTVELSEGIENDVTVLGNHGSEMCASTDIVVVRDKRRERKPHDNDDFKNKGNTN
ncbi:hypothetical protein [Methylomonas methanica]|uniref:DUF11 domain-containing protein n=1 Tax=Methylomonas methanica (strain DSM 25384 / MC09) TaxID=857087 RepID=G0A240_METMM|nr:hypothetical protein [Methylomonas methanica]AEG02583.1 hypothetical protein Metme_4232 [Methylomonas methanica MC09]